MNLYAPNSAVANGTSTPIWLQGNASVAASASVTSDANYIRSGVANPVGTASVTADCTYIHQPDAAAPSASGLFGVATKTHAIAAAVGGSANIQAFVLRDAFAAASISATVEIVAIVADEIGAATVNATAEVTPVGTRIQPQGASAPAGTASIPAVAALARRETTVNLDVSAEVYANPNLNGVSVEFADVIGTTNIVLSNSLVLNTKLQAPGSLSILGAASSVPNATITQTARALPTSVALIVLAEPFIDNIALATLAASAEVAATATITTEATAQPVTATSHATSKALQRFSSEDIVLAASAEITAQTNTTFRPNINFPAQAQTTSSGVIVKVGIAALDADAEVPAVVSVRTTFATATGTAQPSLTVVATRVVKPDATATASSDIVPPPAFIIKAGESDVAAASNVVPIGTRVVTSPVAPDATAEVVDTGAFVTRFGTGLASGVVTLFVDSVANPASLDPPERTFIKPPVQSDFVKLETEFVFRRAA